ncbi:hypothetical protein C7271_19145 [filamentous cyanobacterium CCP5]|nr:hypothetical protein C7271_19145 [filamentous cyanobacterium CCP5]
MAVLTKPQLTSAKDLIFREGRLLERQLYRFCFEEGSREACLKALLAYQNPDGGFGNGIEPDLLCPGSSAIGAETALFVLDMLDYREPDIVLPLLDWLQGNQDEAGGMRHPPQGLEHYPHQPWWEGGDAGRVLAIAAQLSHWQAEKPEFFAKARHFYGQTALPEKPAYYSYPAFLYLAKFRQTEQDEAAFQRLLAMLPTILQENADHFPLFSRAWYPLQKFVEPQVVEKAAAAVAAAFLPEGGVANPYPNLPWWRSIFTLDILMLLRKGEYL